MNKIVKIMCLAVLFACAAITTHSQQASAVTLRDLQGDYRVSESYLGFVKNDPFASLFQDESKGLLISLEYTESEGLKGIVKEPQGDFKAGAVVISSVEFINGKPVCKVGYHPGFKPRNATLQMDTDHALILKEITNNDTLSYWLLTRI